MNEPQVPDESALTASTEGQGAARDPGTSAKFEAISTLIRELTLTSDVAARAGERINVDRRAGIAPSHGDREVFNAWLSSAITLAALSCNRPDPHLKAHGAHLHHLADRLRDNESGTLDGAQAGYSF